MWQDLKRALVLGRFGIDTRYKMADQSLSTRRGQVWTAVHVGHTVMPALQTAWHHIASGVRSIEASPQNIQGLASLGIRYYTSADGHTLRFALPSTLPSRAAVMTAANNARQALTAMHGGARGVGLVGRLVGGGGGAVHGARAADAVYKVSKLLYAQKAAQLAMRHNRVINTLLNAATARMPRERPQNTRERYVRPLKMAAGPKARPTFGSQDWREPRIHLAQHRAAYRSHGGGGGAQSYSPHAGGRSAVRATLAAGRGGGGGGGGRGLGFGGGGRGGGPPRPKPAFQATNAAPRPTAYVNWLQLLRRREPDAQAGQTQSYYARGLVERYMPAQWYHQPLTDAERIRGDPSGQIHHVAPGVATALGRNTGEVIDFLIRESEM